MLQLRLFKNSKRYYCLHRIPLLDLRHRPLGKHRLVRVYPHASCEDEPLYITHAIKRDLIFQNGRSCPVVLCRMQWRLRWIYLHSQPFRTKFVQWFRPTPWPTISSPTSFWAMSIMLSFKQGSHNSSLSTRSFFAFRKDIPC